VNKGLIFDIRRFTVHDGPGIRTTVFFKGCPLDCWWCHNPESHINSPEVSLKQILLEGKNFQQTETVGQWLSVDEVMREIKKDRIFFEESGGGVTFSGGEPLLQVDFLLQILKECRTENIHTTIDTCGYTDPESLASILPYSDLFLFDLKVIDEEDHIAYTGLSNRSILDNLNFLFSQGKKVILRIPIIPGITDTDKNISGIKHHLSTFVSETIPPSSLKISLLPYHSTAKNKYTRFHIENKTKDLKDLTKESLLPLKQEFEAEGFSVKIGG
jgi:pyruvate formate lyase activating enzyme